MKLHEYQAKQLLKKYSIPVPSQRIVESASEAGQVAQAIEQSVVIKAQVLSGGRGKAGGVKIANNPTEAQKMAAEMLALTIKEFSVEKLLVSPASTIVHEYYAAITLERTTKRPVLIMCAEGGIEIEQLAQERPSAIVKIDIDPLKGLDSDLLMQHINAIFQGERIITQAKQIITRLYYLFLEIDCSLVEINPLAEIESQRLVALDAKIVLDDNGLYKHKELEKLRNSEEYSPYELEARTYGLSFISLDGDIGCVVNGAGLAMATMDLIKHFGGMPANFLDVGGSSNPQKVLHALRIICAHSNVRVILINIFGGITRCDDIANGIVMAEKQLRHSLPMVIRLIGTNDEKGRAILTEAGYQVAEQLNEAVQKVVAL